MSTIPPSGQPALRRRRWRKSAAKLRQLLKLCKFHAQKLTSIYRCGCGQRRWGSEWHGGAAVDVEQECVVGGASAAHQRRLLCPRRCRGLTEDVTARAVGQRLWSSGVPPARRQQGRVKSQHTALRSAYRVMAECRRSATMSADVGGDGVTRPLRYDACLFCGERRVDQENVVGGTCERRV